MPLPELLNPLRQACDDPALLRQRASALLGGEPQAALAARLALAMLDLAEAPPESARRALADDQATACLAGEPWRAWTQDFEGLRFFYRGGLPTCVHAALPTFLSRADELVGRLPVRALSFERLDGKLRKLLAWAPLARVRELSFHGNRLGKVGAEQVAGCANLSGLRALELSYCTLPTAGALALAGSAHLGQVEELDLAGNNLGDAGVAALAGAPLAASLTRLDLTGTKLGQEGAAALAASGLPGRLRFLSLGTNDLRRAGLEALLEQPWSALQRLELLETRLDDDGLEHLLRTHALPTLSALRLRNNRGTARWLAALPGSPVLARLGTLLLLKTPLGPEGARSLTRAEAGRLEALALEQAGLDGPALQALLAWPALGRLRSLSLRGSPGLAGQLGPLAASPALAHLERLDLGECALGDADLAQLAASPHLARLQVLELSSSAVGDRGVEALAASSGLPALARLGLGGNPALGDGALRALASARLPQLAALLAYEGTFSEAAVSALLESPGLPRLGYVSLCGRAVPKERQRALAEAFRPRGQLSWYG